MRIFAVLALVLAGPALAQSALSAAQAAQFRSDVAACWLVTDGGAEVTLRFSLDRQGKPDAGSVKLVSKGAGTAQAVEHSFKAAKRAVLRCGQAGYTLPVEKYDQWRDIELTFDPERTSLR